MSPAYVRKERFDSSKPSVKRNRASPRSSGSRSCGNPDLVSTSIEGEHPRCRRLRQRVLEDRAPVGIVDVEDVVARRCTRRASPSRGRTGRPSAAANRPLNPRSSSMSLIVYTSVSSRSAAVRSPAGPRIPPVAAPPEEERGHLDHDHRRRNSLARHVAVDDRHVAVVELLEVEVVSRDALRALVVPVDIEPIGLPPSRAALPPAASSSRGRNFFCTSLPTSSSALSFAACTRPRVISLTASASVPISSRVPIAISSSCDLSSVSRIFATPAARVFTGRIVMPGEDDRADDAGGDRRERDAQHGVEETRTSPRRFRCRSPPSRWSAGPSRGRTSRPGRNRRLGR